LNHLEGTSGFFTVSVPLGLDNNVATVEAGRTVKAKF
jgi:hypothetical protein